MRRGSRGNVGKGLRKRGHVRRETNQIRRGDSRFPHLERGCSGEMGPGYLGKQEGLEAEGREAVKKGL